MILDLSHINVYLSKHLISKFDITSAHARRPDLIVT